MRRRQDWDLRLAAAVEAARGRAFAWGAHDCATWAFDTVAEMTGAPSAAAAWRGRYATETGAARVLRRLGNDGLESLVRAELGAPLASVRLARRGDVVLGGTPEAVGLCAGPRAVFVGPAGTATLPMAACRLAWRVG